ncbi:MAG: lytic transglycosylase domain-containing protein [Gammaproteobacteria bacterium]
MIPVMINDVPVDCINHAAVVYHVPATLILAVIKKENGINGQAVKNKNSTYDYGVMQINDIWLTKIAAFGYTKNDIKYNACKNVFVGTWILAQSIAEGKDIWRGVGNYHSHTLVFNKSYKKSISVTYAKLTNVIYGG